MTNNSEISEISHNMCDNQFSQYNTVWWEWMVLWHKWHSVWRSVALKNSKKRIFAHVGRKKWQVLRRFEGISHISPRKLRTSRRGTRIGCLWWPYVHGQGRNGETCVTTADFVSRTEICMWDIVYFWRPRILYHMHVRMGKARNSMKTSNIVEFLQKLQSGH